MMRRSRTMLAWLLPAALAGCGHSAPTVLHGLPAIAPARTFGGYAGPPVRVDAVRLPPAIDRIELLRALDDGRYNVLEFDRWAAPPARLARAALTENLAIRLPAGAVLTDASADASPATVVSADILSLTVGRDSAVLVVNWSRGCRPADALDRHYARLEAPAIGDTPAALAALIGRLADLIAADVAARPDRACADPAVTRSRVRGKAQP